MPESDLGGAPAAGEASESALDLNAEFLPTPCVLFESLLCDDCVAVSRA